MCLFVRGKPGVSRGRHTHGSSICVSQSANMSFPVKNWMVLVLPWDGHAGLLARLNEGGPSCSNSRSVDESRCIPVGETPYPQSKPSFHLQQVSEVRDANGNESDQGVAHQL